jgi:hypothetical protein
MAFAYPSLDQQQIVFDYLRGDIDRDLRKAGIDDMLALHGFIVPEPGNELGASEFSKIIVARRNGYSTQLADIDHDLDPLASVMSTEYEVGVIYEKRQGTRNLERSYKGIGVTRGLMGGAHEPIEMGQEMSHEQRDVVTQSIGRLITAKSRVFIPALTKSLKKIDLAGD